MLTKQRQVAAILEVHVTEIANQSIKQLKKYESKHQIRFVFSASEKHR